MDRRLDRASRAPLVVGVSGGSDSLALLVIALDWARSAGREVVALTVDHGLNPDSAGWTAEAGAVARRLGASWRALAWRGDKPSTGLPAAARRARHALLANAARAVGASVVLLGHTADDVAECELIRRETPSHGYLAEWAPSPVWPEGYGVFLLRPLLSLGRRPLRDLLTARGLAWLEDPSNGDLRYARSRARAVLGRGGADRPASEVSGEGQCAGPLRRGRPTEPRPSPVDADVGGLWGAGVTGVSGAGVVSVDLTILTSEGLVRALACASGCERSPSGAAVTRLGRRVSAGEAGAATLGGARIAFAKGVAAMSRELGRGRREPMRLTPGEAAVFDGRFVLGVKAPGWRAAHLAGHAARLPPQDRRGLARVAAPARPALPVLLGPDGVARLPRPFGEGPGEARELVSARLAAALGQIADEGRLGQVLRPNAVHGA